MKIQLFLAMSLVASLCSAAEPERVSWLEDVPFSQVVREAQNSPERPILIDFYAQWCRPCKLLDVMVYNEAEVIDELADVLTFKVDIDKPEYRDLKEKFNISVLPTLVWLDERGRELDRFTGYQNKNEFLEIVRSIRQGDDTFYRIIDLQINRPEDPGLMFDLARRYAEQGDRIRAEIFYRRLMGLRFRGDKSVVTHGMLGLAAMEELVGRHDQARGLARRAATSFTAEDTMATASLMAVAEFQGTLGDTTGVLDTYRRLIAFDDRNVVALDGFVRTATATGRELDQATKYGLRAVIMSGNDPRSMESLARCYASRRLFHKAKRWMKKAVGKDPDNERYHELLAQYMVEMEKSPFQYRGRRR